MISASPAGNVGDFNQSAGIAGAIRRALDQAKIAGSSDISSETLEIASSSTASGAEQLSAACETWLTKLRDGEYERVIFILSGSGGNLALALGGMPPEKGFTTVFSGHQLSDDIKSAERLPLITALPETGVTAEQKSALESKTQLVLVSGVAHQVSQDKIAKTVEDYRTKGYKRLPAIDVDTVAVILGGDAPDEKGRYKFFSADDARRLARRIAKVEFSERKGCRFIVTNGPRTGKFDGDRIECEPNPHRTANADHPGVVDHVTSAFVEELERFEGAEVHLLDFQFNRSPSAYLPLIHAFAQAGSNRGHFHVPGESTSMVSEIAPLFRGVVIDKIPSMNDSHRKHVRQVRRQTGADLLDSFGKLHRGARESRQPQSISAADQIANAVVSHIQQETRLPATTE